MGTEPMIHLAPLQILINNAGMYGKRGSLQDYTAEDFLQPYITNAVGPFLVVQQLQKQGLFAKPALVVNITSIMASHGDQTVSSAAGGGYAYRWGTFLAGMAAVVATVTAAVEQR